MRIIAAAGIVANISVGILVILASRSISGTSPATRYFAWVFGHSTLFMGSAYLAGMAFLPFGDVHAAIQGLQPQLLFRTLAALGGLAIYRATLIDARLEFANWVCGEPRSRITGLALVPYSAMGVTVTAASLLNPGDALMGALWGAAATFGASYGLVAATNVGTGERNAAVPERMVIPRNRGWIVAGLASIFVLFVILGPGIPRSG